MPIFSSSSSSGLYLPTFVCIIYFYSYFVKFLGYPIVDDNLYNDEVWGPNKGKSSEYGKSESEVPNNSFIIFVFSRLK